VSGIPNLHTDVAAFEVRDGCLCVGGRTVTDIMAEAGDVPAYLYDRELIRQRIRELRNALPKGISLHYAIKANPMPEVVAFVATLVDGLDIASAGELEVALGTSCDPEDISFAGPGKKLHELQAAVDAGVTLNVESSTELERLASIKSANRPRAAIRVNPDFELKSSGMKMSGGPKPFGIDAEVVPDVLIAMRDMPIDFAGFHIFSGAQNLNPESICNSQRQALSLALELSAHAPSPPGFINIGGGFGIPYFPGDEPLELTSIGRNLESLSAQLKARIPDCKLVIELGRYIVGEAGVYASTITDRKVSRGHTFLVVDGGLHQHLSASGNFGQIIRKNYPVAIANRIGADDREVASVVGPLCTPLDLLADKMELARADIGDLVVVFQSGAYGFTASPHRFLGHPPPVELLL